MLRDHCILYWRKKRFNIIYVLNSINLREVLGGVLEFILEFVLYSLMKYVMFKLFF